MSETKIAIYGIWIPDETDSTKGGWLRFSNGQIFQSPSRGCAEAQLEAGFGQHSTAQIKPFDFITL